MAMHIDRLCVVGVGLIGGSFARALRKAGVVKEIVGCNRDKDQLQKAIDLGVIDSAETDISKAVTGAHLIVVATPVGAMESVFAQIAQKLDPNAILTDVGSSKASVVAAVRSAFGKIPTNFVPGHPIAGTEKSGVEASFPELFRDRKVILTPLPETDVAAVLRVRQAWAAAGAQVVEMSVQHHDQVLAATSHLPHVLAYSLVHCLAQMDDSQEIFNYAAGGFRDFTRIASSDPRMWHDICLANRDELLGVIKTFGMELEQLAKALRSGDGQYLLKVFQQAKEARDRFAEKK